jgi:branched-chain amino acid transport system substrate-binding protein
LTVLSFITFRRGVSRSKLLFFAVAAATAAAASGCAAAESASSGSAPGVSSKTIVLGTSSGLTGPAGSYAVALQRGTDAWFKKVNADGGVHGRTIEYTALDDGLDVSRAISNVKSLIREPVLAVVGGTGAGSIVPMAQALDAADVPYLFPPTGKPEFAEDVMPSVFAMVPTFSEQAAALAAWSATESGPGSYYLMTAETTDQAAQATATQKAVEDAGGEWLGSAVVPIGTADVTPYALKAAADRPDYLIMTTAPADSIKIINALADAGRLPAKAILGGTAMTGEALIEGVTDETARARLHALSAVVPATDQRAEGCNAALETYYPDQVPDGASTFGCAMAQATVTALEEIGPDLTREALVDALEAMSGARASDVMTPLTFGESSHMGMETMPLVRIDGSQFSVEAEIPLAGR